MLSFNARNSTPEEIARNLIVPSYISRVASFQNTILIGPRGIGKTTILKALTPSGLTELSKRMDVREEIDFPLIDYTPVYIPAESIWKGVSESIASSGLKSCSADLVLNGIFTFHCLHQIISGIETVRDIWESANNREELPWIFSISDSQEAKISRLLSEYWNLEKECNSFLSLKLELTKQANKYRRAVSQLDGKAKIADLQEVDLINDLKIFLDVVSDICKRSRWSFSFDEMEIAPSSVMAYLYENLRSFDQRAVFKFSLFPLPDFYALEEYEKKVKSGPGPGQDYDPVVLSNRFKKLDLDFADSIVASECHSRGIPHTEFVGFINSSRAINTRKYTIGEIKPVRDYARIYEAARSSGDLGVTAYLSKKGITNSRDVIALKGDNKRAEIRKIAPIAELRTYYFRKISDGPTPDEASRGSVKNYGYYHGYDQLLTLTEGNPRALKFFLADLFDGYVDGKSSAATQNDAIPLNVDRFRALVAAQTAGVTKINLRQFSKSPLEVIDALGRCLGANVLGKSFKAEPALSFEVHDPDPELNIAVINGVNAGALVLDNSADAQGVRFTVNGCRFRMSHRLAPFFKLPTITGSSRLISSTPSDRDVIARQPDLLSWINNDA